MTSWLRGLIVAGVVLGASLTVLGLCAQWWPALDIANNGLPFVAAGALLILVLAAFTRDWRLILSAGLVAGVNLFLVVAAWQGAAAQAAPGSQRFMRVVTFNLWEGNERMEDVAKFLTEANADAVVLQEVTREHGTAPSPGARLTLSLCARRNATRHSLQASHPGRGRIDRPGYPPWISLMLRWIRLDVNGTIFELAGVHLTRPYYVELQEQDIEALIQFAQSRGVPLGAPWLGSDHRLIVVDIALAAPVSPGEK